MGRVISSVSFSLFLSICFPPAETRHLHGLPVFLHLVPSRFASFFLSLSRHCEAREGTLVLRGGRQGRQMGFQTSLPRLLCVSCGSGVRFWKHMHMRGGGRGEYNLRRVVWPKKQHSYRSKEKETKERFTTEDLQGNFPLGKMQAPEGQEERVGLEVDLFPAVWEMSRGSLPSARGFLGRYTP